MFKKLVQMIGIIMILSSLFTIPVQAASTHSIVGRVTTSTGVKLRGVTVTIQGTTSSDVTDANGIYSLRATTGSSGTIVPSLANYTFSPVNIKFTNIQANLVGQDFTATQINNVYYSISGKVTNGGSALAGVLITFGTFTATTSSTGTYTIANVPAGAKGRIVPSLAGYAFTPGYVAISSLNSNLVNQDFTATVAYTISGVVTDQATSLPLAGVIITFGAFSDVSSSTTGAYNIRNVPAGTSGTLVPSQSGKTFTPLSITVTNLQANLHSQNFVAAP
jgi:hypothetical protein